MVQREKGRCMDDAATTLHPCWEAYRLADKYGMFVLLLVFFFSICLLRVGSLMIFSFQEGSCCLFECVLRGCYDRIPKHATNGSRRSMELRHYYFKLGLCRNILFIEFMILLEDSGRCYGSWEDHHDYSSPPHS